MTPEHAAVRTESPVEAPKISIEEYQRRREWLVDERRRVSKLYGFSSDEYLAAVDSERALVAEAIQVHAVNNPKHPGCQECRRVSVFGGPGHDPSGGCRSGRRPHCTCDSCF